MAIEKRRYLTKLTPSDTQRAREREKGRERERERERIHQKNKIFRAIAPIKLKFNICVGTIRR